MSDLMAACPFCGGTDQFVEPSDFSSAYVVCNDCCARGPNACQEDDDEETPGEASARIQWNRRALSDQNRLTGGWRAVPEEPTQEMIRAGMVAEAPPYEGTTNSLDRHALLAKSIYQTMLAASPPLPLPGGEEKR